MSEFSLTPEEKLALCQGLDDSLAKEADAVCTVPFEARDGLQIQRQLEALRAYHEDVAARFEDALSQALQRVVELRLGSVESMAYSQFAFSRPLPTCLVILQATPLKTPLALEFSPNILYPILDCLLGGGKHDCEIPTRPATELEQRLATRITHFLLEQLHDAWEPLLAVSLNVDRIESNAQRVRLVAPSETVTTLQFEVRLGKQTGSFTLCLPQRGIQKMVDKLLADEVGGDKSSRKERSPKDSVELSVVVTAKEMSAVEVDSLEIGDMILTDLDVQEAVDVCVDGQPTMKGRLGAYQGFRAVVIR